jgi:3D (Asp-Asp-Asp) domain-containing protein
MTVSVIRVRRCRVTEEAAVPAKTVALAAPRLPAGYTKLLEQGRDGLVRRVVEVWEKDGQETQRTVLAEKVLVRARNTVVLRGAQGLPSRGGDLHQPLRMVATGYAAYHCGGSPTGHTASGRPAVRGVVAVDTRVIAMGTRLYIPGYGFAIAADRGSAIRGHRIDLCFDSYTEALRFGRRAIDVYVLR